MTFSTSSTHQHAAFSHRSFSPSQILPDYSPPLRSPGPAGTAAGTATVAAAAAGTAAAAQQPNRLATRLATPHNINPASLEQLRADDTSPTIPSEPEFAQTGSGSNMSATESEDGGPQIFDDQAGLNGYDDDDPSEPTTRHQSGDHIPSPFDLKPPPPAAPLSNIELLADRLFSADHLRLILRDANLLSRFTNFLNKYKPESGQVLRQCIDIHKALAAIEYANAVADQLGHSLPAANLDNEFEARASDAIDILISDALPGYVAHRLVQLTTETLVKEITGQNTPLMRDLVQGLAEVYCLTDPSLPDNPIVYASEEFYKCTQYGRDYVIGRNCRFLQGPRTSGNSVHRLVEALAEGQEVCEVILNYRRDGSPFMNLLMIAPLYDNKGTVRYFIGAQIDINGLVEGGRGLDSFARLLSQDKAAQRYGGIAPKQPGALLGDLSAMWNSQEMEITRRQVHDRSDSESVSSRSTKRPAGGRRYLGMDDPDDSKLWPAPHLGPSGRLPGVFQNYLLVRPYPSLRITFTSPALRIPGLLQSKFLDRVGGPIHIRDGILSAFSSGIGVTAKIIWMPGGTANPSVPQNLAGGPLNSGASIDSRHSSPSTKAHPDRPPRAVPDGKPRWIHCTPLLGSDDRVGVWMVVMVESETITGALNAHERAVDANHAALASPRGSGPGLAVTSPRYNGDRLYTEYLRREGRQDSMIGGGGPADRAPSIRAPAPGVIDQFPNPPAIPGEQLALPHHPASEARSRTASRAHAQDIKALKARQIADRAAAGHDQFRDF